MIRAPFPWFGGKSRAADLIWSRLGDVANYIEPFAGSLAVLLARSTEPRIETVNDLDAMVANFWRATATHPDLVAHHADWPVSEPDLHARHRWLVAQLPALRRKLVQDPDYCDPRVAGWWVWGISQWIGSGWCSGSHAMAGVHAQPHQKRPAIGGDNAGRGVHSGAQIPRCNGLGGQGIHGAKVPSQQLPYLNVLRSSKHPEKGDIDGMGINSKTATGLQDWFAALQQRLRRVRVCCGDWKRIMGPSVIYGNGMTGIVLDPPYSHEVRARDLYAEDKDVSAEVRAWAIEHGDDSRLRIVLCGYEGEHDMPATWECVAWKANGGYGNVTGNANKHMERLWFSPHCLRAAGQLALLEVAHV